LVNIAAQATARIAIMPLLQAQLAASGIDSLRVQVARAVFYDQKLKRLYQRQSLSQQGSNALLMSKPKET
jgi:hypothetical protein